MTLIAADLKDLLISAVDGKSSASTLHDDIASAIKSYVEDNAELSGVYAGLNATAAPDPLCGPYKWKVTTLALEGSTLLSAAQGGFQAWLLALQSALQAATFTGLDTTGMVTITPVTMATMFLSCSIDNEKDYENAWDKISSAVINGIKGCVCPPSTGVTTTPGTGPVTFTGIL